MGWRRHLPRVSRARVRAARGSTLDVLRRRRQELAVTRFSSTAWKAWRGTEKPPWSAGRRAFPIAREGGTPRTRAGAVSPTARGASQAPAFPALRAPRLSRGGREGETPARLIRAEPAQFCRMRLSRCFQKILPSAAHSTNFPKNHKPDVKQRLLPRLSGECGIRSVSVWR